MKWAHAPDEGRVVLKERLQKILSHAGVCSRRKAEELILAGRVRVNGRVVRELGTEADVRTDKIEALGEIVKPEPLRYYLFHKPDCVITSVLQILRDEERSIVISAVCGNVYFPWEDWIIIRRGFF